MIDPDSPPHRTKDVPRIDLTTVSDSALVVSMARYQQEALAEAYRRHAGAVFGLARRLLSNQAQAEEVVQEVFLRLWNQPERFDGERGSLRSYLLAQCHGRSVDLLRSETARRRREERDAKEVPATAPFEFERQLWDMSVAEQVRGALETLQAGERAAIELAYFGGRTYREVASILGEAEGTVKSRIRTGLKRMRTQLVASGVMVGGA
jgi:RNA polymerase sigma-70 factor, ECF subfamily